MRTKLAFALCFFASTVHAETAKQAYDRGVAAHEKKDYANAAKAFAEADAIAPSNVALQAAIDEAVLADDPVLGAELLERTHRTGASLKALDGAKKKFTGRAGRIRVKHGETCTAATLDDKIVDPKKDIWTTKGPHTLTVSCGARAADLGVDVNADAVLDVDPPIANRPPAEPIPTPTPPAPVPTTTEAPPPPPPPTAVTPSSSGKPFKPVVPIVTGGVTLLMVAGAIVFGLDTKHQHDDFQSKGCDKAYADGCQDLKDDGEHAQTLANVAIGVGAVAAATTVFFLFLTDFHSGVAVAPVPGGVAGTWSARF